MYVRQLIGRQAGVIIEMPFHAAEACLSNGTVSAVTDEEIAAAGLAPSQAHREANPDEMPEGYRAAPAADGGGFDVVDDGGVILNKEFLPNLPAARSFAHALVASQSTPAPADAPAADEGAPTTNPEPGADAVEIPEGWASLSSNKLKSLAAKLTTDPIRNKADAVAAIEAEFARRAAAAPAETPTAETPASTDAPPAGDGQGDAENPAQA